MFEATCEPRKIRIAMAATTSNIDEAEACLCSLLGGDVAIDRFAVRILLREALLNAVIHGSGEDEGRVVHMEAELAQSGLILTVRDDGDGFAWQGRQEDVGILGDSGRGIPLMHIYASEVRFNEAGNEVTLYRNYEGIPETASAKGAGR
jgi:serine/threonine-protein kinase RsbW